MVHFFIVRAVLAFIAMTFFAYILWIIYLADTGGKNIVFDLVRQIPYGDKVGHFCLFGTLTVLINAALQFRTFYLRRMPIYWGSCAVAAFVLLEELSQAFFPTRTLDIWDLTADAIGISLASLLSFGWQRLALKRH